MASVTLASTATATACIVPSLSSVSSAFSVPSGPSVLSDSAVSSTSFTSSSAFTSSTVVPISHADPVSLSVSSAASPPCSGCLGSVCMLSSLPALSTSVASWWESVPGITPGTHTFDIYPDDEGKQWWIRTFPSLRRPATLPTKEDKASIEMGKAAQSNGSDRKSICRKNVSCRMLWYKLRKEFPVIPKPTILAVIYSLMDRPHSRFIVTRSSWCIFLSRFGPFRSAIERAAASVLDSSGAALGHVLGPMKNLSDVAALIPAIGDYCIHSSASIPAKFGIKLAARHPIGLLSLDIINRNGEFYVNGDDSASYRTIQEVEAYLQRRFVIRRRITVHLDTAWPGYKQALTNLPQIKPSAALQRSVTFAYVPSRLAQLNLPTFSRSREQSWLGYARTASPSDEDVKDMLCGEVASGGGGLVPEVAQLVLDYAVEGASFVCCVLDRSGSMGTQDKGFALSRERYQSEVVGRIMGNGCIVPAQPTTGAVVTFQTSSEIMMSPRLEDVCPKCERARDEVLSVEGKCQSCGVNASEFVRKHDLSTFPLSRPLGPEFVSDFGKRDGKVRSGGGTSFNAAMGRVREVVQQYGTSIRVLGRRAHIPLHYTILLLTDGEDSAVSLRSLMDFGGRVFPMVTCVIGADISPEGLKELSNVSTVVNAAPDIDNTVRDLSTALMYGLSQTCAIRVENRHPRRYLHIPECHAWIPPKKNLIIHRTHQLAAAPLSCEFIWIPPDQRRVMQNVSTQEATVVRSRYRARQWQPSN